MTFTGGYRLSGSSDSRLSVPVVAPPPSLCQPMTQLFKAHEEKRVRLRVQHAIQREKLTISCEQEIMRVHSRAARTNQNQQVNLNKVLTVRNSRTGVPKVIRSIALFQSLANRIILIKCLDI